MNNNFKMISCALAGVMIGGISVVCANQAIQAMQNTEIKVSLNGQVQEFKDETTGERQYPITYNNRTYLPLRNVAQLVGLSVDYDSDSNTAILNSDANNDYAEMEKILKENIKDVDLIVDIDKNGIPEAIKMGSSILGEVPFEAYTLDNDKVIPLVMVNPYIFSNVFVIYETEEGVFLYENDGDGPVNDIVIYKLNVIDQYLDGSQILRHYTQGAYSEGDYLGLIEDDNYVDGIRVNEEEYNEKIDELNRIKLIKKNVYRDEKNVLSVDYENLWN